MLHSKMLTDSALLERIERAPLPAGPGQTFATRLAAILHLSQSAAETALSEYRKFLYLATIADSPRIPPELVGLAWRLHAMHPEYKTHFCPEVLGRDLPYLTGYDDAPGWMQPARPILLDPIELDIAYRRTRMDYAVEFGESAPAPIWPATERSADSRAIVVATGILVASAVIGIVADDIRILSAGALASGLVHVVSTYRGRDIRSLAGEAIDQIFDGDGM